MYSIRRWLFRPKKSDAALLAKFYFTDEELNQVAAELDSFDGRKDPERCTALVTKLRSCQDKVLNVIEKIILDAIPTLKANRDFRVKFPDDVLQESLAGQLWFGAECLAAGSSIMNRELESASMRPLARALTKNLDRLRSLLREQCLRSYSYNERIKEALVIFDKLFAEFEYSYVSTMVPVKSKKEYDLLQEITVLFSETVQRALKIKLLTQDQIDDCDPALMFTIPRLAMVCGLLIYPNGPLNPICDRLEMSEMFRPFQTLLIKIKELLQTLSSQELASLEKSLCTNEPVEKVIPKTTLVNQNSQTDPGFEDSTEEADNNADITVTLEKTLDNKSSNERLDKINQLDESQQTLSPSDDRNFISHLNKSESRDSGLQSENTSTSGTVSCGVVSPEEENRYLGTNEVLDDINSATPKEVDICDNETISMTTTSAHSTESLGDNNICDTTDAENIHDICLSIINDIINNCAGQPSNDINSEIPQMASYNLCSDCDKQTEDLNSVTKFENRKQTENQPDVKVTSDSKNVQETENDPSAQGCSKVSPSEASNIDKKHGSEPPLDEQQSCSTSRSHSKTTQSRKPPIDRIHCKTGSTAKSGARQGKPESNAKSETQKGKSRNSSTTQETHRNKTRRQDVGVRRVRYNGTISNTFSSVHDNNYDWERESSDSSGSSDTSSYTSDSQDDEEIELAVKAAAVASKKEIRSRFRSSSDLIHRLFVCISGVADQLQTNYAGDLRNILKSVFDMNSSSEPDEIESVGTKFDRTQQIQAQLQAARVNRYRRSNSNHSHRSREPPEWVPDEQAISCTSCQAIFTFVRRRHHCRNCGKIFCGQCSNNNVPLPHFGHSTPVRVCNRCFMFQVTPFVSES
ncbi:Lateral signaling target protein 2 homolog,Lateral signaling target protein 2 [Mytilus coruscus]|uniref:Lateral signaling target protein 2 homolog,Lateral signaling target protein 2 n=1 Tax=Mytilus coruscus TaxID=42192 RepID=A0A6J8DBB5_MYTCO|nr:Lateral signaling target protein 2 homolog,Lateral signaling target protein 2 [Mytilus coruscus]